MSGGKRGADGGGVGDGAAGGAQAQATRARSLSGFDVLNRSESFVHTFLAEYSRLSVDAFLEVDPGDFQDVRIGTTQSGVRVEWSGGNVGAWDWAHGGFSLDERPPQRFRVTRYELYGPQSRTIVDANGQPWNSVGGGRWRDRIDGACCFINVDRRVLITDQELLLADMEPYGPLRERAKSVDGGFVPLPPEGLDYEYPAVPPNVWCVMIDDVMDTRTGEVVMAFCNAVQGTPCTADVNGDGVLDSDDFFDFLNAYFAGGVDGDFNGDGVLDSDDFFDYLNAFFEG